MADEPHNLHRNNLAEWVMAAVLYPAARLARILSFVASFASSRIRG